MVHYGGKLIPMDLKKCSRSHVPVKLDEISCGMIRSKSPLWTAKIIERANQEIQCSGLVRLWTYENQRL